MDDELQQLETELKKLRPVPPPAVLHARLHQALGPTVARAAAVAGPGPRSRFPWWWAALPAAAALALVVSLKLRNQPAAAPLSAPAPLAATGGMFKPVEARNVLFSARDEGLVTLDDGTPARRERLQFVDTITWRNPRTNASLTWSVPREEVRVVPVSFH